MTSSRGPKVAGIQPTISPPSQTAAPGSGQTPADRVSDLTSLHELAAELARTDSVDSALRETLRAGAALLGARRGMVALEPTPPVPGAAPGDCPERTIGLGLGHADLGQIETVPRSSASHTRILDGAGQRTADAVRPAYADGPEQPERLEAPEEVDGLEGGWPDPAPGTAAGPGNVSRSGSGPKPGPGPGPGPGSAPGPGPSAEIAYPDIATDEALDPRHREVAARLGYAASYAVPLTTEDGTRLGAAVWLYDEPAEPSTRQRELLARYLRHAAAHTAHLGELARARDELRTLREELLPSSLPRVPGVTLAVRHRTGPSGGGDWYDALPLPEHALGIAVGGVTGSGPTAVAAMGRLRASLRAYAVMEGEDPVAVLSDLELLLRLTEPARSATALFAYAEPAARKILIAGAGHCPPLIVGPARVEPVETALSAPLGMLACWEAPSAEVTLRAGETLLFYSDGLLHRTGDSMDRAFSRLHSAASDAPRDVREDPEALAEHVLRTVLPGPLADQHDHPEDVVLLAARF